MNEEFRASIRRAIRRCRKQGIVIRKMTVRETEAYDKSLPTPTKSTSPMPFKARVKQTTKVRRISKEQGITIVDACEQVGISFSNYKSVRAALKKGITKRP